MFNQLIIRILFLVFIVTAITSCQKDELIQPQQGNEATVNARTLGDGIRKLQLKAKEDLLKRESAAKTEASSENDIYKETTKEKLKASDEAFDGAEIKDGDNNEGDDDAENEVDL